MNVVLLTKDYVPKLCDFGLSELRGATVASINSQAVTGETGGAAGTMAYMAPELLDFTIDASEETDMYSFGILLSNEDSGRPDPTYVPSPLSTCGPPPSLRTNSSPKSSPIMISKLSSLAAARMPRPSTPRPADARGCRVRNTCRLSWWR